MDLSGKINEGIVEIYKVVADVAGVLNIPFFVIGATARDIVLEFGYGIEPSRATLDIDLGVKVADWQQFSELTEQLIATKKFRESQSAQRFFYEDNLSLDIVPFGQISGSEVSIAWPPKHEVEMNVLGFDEAYSHALLVRLGSNPNFEIYFASPAGWALLKIISWNDRTGGDRVKDALDLSLILRKYAEVGNEERLYETEAGLLEEEEYDLEYAGARLLGRDISGIAKQKSREKILEILGRETGEQERYQLVEDMVQNKAFANEGFDKNIRLIEKLKQGIVEVNLA